MLGAIKRQLLDQLRAALREKEGGSGLGDLLGPALARSCRRSWIHFNLREVIQLEFQLEFKFSTVLDRVSDPFLFDTDPDPDPAF
jgi:hypothetical protein